ncbi:hypothetical protein SS50377_24850 [Spironucleus salmonicida]|uniref:Dynein axonemal assembly factor 5 TPR repeats domain-containing protein n=1 Tax=Spironucleus salmonicida TaxID=348837 RepID=V6M6S3_9EUKA|nr:hypothetical protein SS50377_24850 [Spironucleus salmonicida]|eukprot:EST49119.1 hypothetical protein SS50377_10605 [Spironucleus salmonicida]
MDLARACSTLIDKEQQRNLSKQAILLIQEQIDEQNISQVVSAVYSSMRSKFDAVRSTAAEILIDNVQEFISQDFDSLFFNVTSIVDTKNLPFDTYEKSETVREDLLTVLLKIIINIEKTQISSVQLEKSHQKFSDAITSILIKQSTDKCPNCRIQTDKCIFRFTRTFKHFLTETQVSDLSEGIIATFNHNQKTVRQLNLQAFTQTHLSTQSKQINRHLQKLLPLLLNDPLLTDSLADAMKILLFNHIDRHIYADIFAVPLLSNLHEIYSFNIFLSCGEFYVLETKQHDKFLHLQQEIENTVTGQDDKYDEFIANFNKNSAPHFDKQLNLGCRILAQQVLEKQLNAIIRDLESVQNHVKLASSRLLCNLIILSHNFTAKFGQKFANSLQFLLHDEFNKGEFDPLIELMAVFCAPNDILGQIKKQISTQSAENSRFLSRIYAFLGRFLMFRGMENTFSNEMQNTDIEVILTILASSDYLMNEDYLLVVSQSVCCGHFCQFLQQKPDLFTLLSEDQQQVFFILVSAVYVKLSNQELLTAKKHVFDEFIATTAFKVSKKLTEEFISIFDQFKANLNFALALQTINLNSEILKTDRLVIRCQIFAQFLNFTKRFDFATKNAQKAVNIAVKMLKISADVEKMNQDVRFECLECVRILSQQINLRQDQLIFLINGVYSCTTWRHGARSPKCLVKAIEILTVLVDKQRTELCQAFPYAECDNCSEFGATYDQLLSRICVSLEDDWQAVREVVLALCGQFLSYCQQFGMRPDELGLKLCYRLDDAKESITLSALDQLRQLVEICENKGIVDQLYGKDQIIELLVTHCDDPNVRIREKCVCLTKEFIVREEFCERGKDKAKLMNWQYLGENDRTWLQ